MRVVSLFFYCQDCGRADKDRKNSRSTGVSPVMEYRRCWNTGETPVPRKTGTSEERGDREGKNRAAGIPSRRRPPRPSLSPQERRHPKVDHDYQRRKISANSRGDVNAWKISDSGHRGRWGELCDQLNISPAIHKGLVTPRRIRLSLSLGFSLLGAFSRYLLDRLNGLSLIIMLA